MPTRPKQPSESGLSEFAPISHTRLPPPPLTQAPTPIGNVLQAEHEAAVTSVGAPRDGLHICVGTESGAVGVLYIPGQQYRTLLRSHMGTVQAVAADPIRCVEALEAVVE